MDGTYRRQERVQGWVVGSYQTVPREVDVIQSPSVLEFGTGGLASYQRGVVGIRVERRVEVDQVTRLAVHSPHDVEVVARPDGLVDPVGRVGTVLALSHMSTAPLHVELLDIAGAI